MFSTKYPNNIRTVSGVVILRNDDVTLECDTTLGPVVINLSAIPANYWNTLWKLYVVDKSGNAGANNITINAGVGQTINGAASFVLSTNNESAVLSVVDNSKYVVFSSLTVGPSISGFISLTNAQLIALITAKTVVQGQKYLVTDAGLSDLGVVVEGIKNDTVTDYGTGLFFNADYQKVGTYTTVAPPFVAALGLWSAVAQVVVPGNCVVWNNNHYVNLTGNWGTAPDTDIVNWLLLARIQTNGYIPVADFVIYNVAGNLVVRREDNVLNKVDYHKKGTDISLTLFQWGKNNVNANSVFAGSIMYCTNSFSKFIGNVLIDSELRDSSDGAKIGTIQNNIIQCNGLLDLGNTYGVVQDNFISDGDITVSAGTRLIDSDTQLRDNHVESGGKIQFANMLMDSNVSRNHIIRESSLIALDVSGFMRNNFASDKGILSAKDVVRPGGIEFCEASDSNTVYLDNVLAAYSYKKIRKGYSNWELTVDCSNPANYDLPTLTLTIPPAGTNFYGIIILTNSTGLVIQKIVNESDNHITRFMPADTFSVSFKHTLISLAVANDLLCDAPGSTNLITGRANGSDFIEYEVAGTMKRRYNLVLIA